MSKNIEVTTWSIFGIPVVRKTFEIKQPFTSAVAKGIAPRTPRPRPKNEAKPFKDPNRFPWSVNANVHPLER
jgi:hypothetical protein